MIDYLIVTFIICSSIFIIENRVIKVILYNTVGIGKGFKKKLIISLFTCLINTIILLSFLMSTSIIITDLSMREYIITIVLAIYGVKIITEARIIHRITDAINKIFK